MRHKKSPVKGSYINVHILEQLVVFNFLVSFKTSFAFLGFENTRACILLHFEMKLVGKLGLVNFNMDSILIFHDIYIVNLS